MSSNNTVTRAQKIIDALLYHLDNHDCEHCKKFLSGVLANDYSSVRQCKYCDAAIEINDKSGRYLPYNENGTRHFCGKVKSQ